MEGPCYRASIRHTEKTVEQLYKMQYYVYEKPHMVLRLPVGSCLFVGCGIAKVKIEGVTKYIVPIFISMVVALFLVTYIPQISLSLPYWTKLIPAMGWNG